jgi:hypothetical protein
MPTSSPQKYAEFFLPQKIKPAERRHDLGGEVDGMTMQQTISPTSAARSLTESVRPSIQLAGNNRKDQENRSCGQGEVEQRRVRRTRSHWKITPRAAGAPCARSTSTNGCRAVATMAAEEKYSASEDSPASHAHPKSARLGFRHDVVVVRRPPDPPRLAGASAAGGSTGAEP